MIHAVYLVNYKGVRYKIMAQPSWCRKSAGGIFLSRFLVGIQRPKNQSKGEHRERIVKHALIPRRPNIIIWSTVIGIRTLHLTLGPYVTHMADSSAAPLALRMSPVEER